MHGTILTGIFVLFAVVLQGCVSTLTVHPNKAEGQVVFYVDGSPVLQSTQTNVVRIAQITGSFRANQFPEFMVAVINGSDEPFDFSPEDVTARTNAGPLTVFTYEDIVKQIEAERIGRAIGAAFSAYGRGYQAAQAGNTYHYGSAFATGPGGHAYGNYSGYSYNYGAAAEAQAHAQAQTQRESNAIRVDVERKLSEANSIILKRQTIFPGTVHIGVVRLDKIEDWQNGTTLGFSINAGGETHAFSFDVEPEKK